MRVLVRNTTLLLLCVCCLSFGLVQAQTTAASLGSAPYQLTLEGQSIPVVQGTHVEKSYYARFLIGGNATLRVQSPLQQNMAWTLLPEESAKALVHEGQGITLSLSDTQPRILQGAGLPYLFLFPERIQPAPDWADTPVLSIAPSGETPLVHGQRIQAAIDRLSTSGGGVLLLKPGLHRSSALRLRSHVTLYLEAGAVLQGTGLPAHYRWDKYSPTFILVDHADYAAIRGLGTIDGAGHILQQQHGTKAHLIDVLGSTHFTLEDVVLRDPGGWTVHLINCSHVNLSRIKILSDWALSNTDGIDPDMSHHVRIQDCFIYSGDDAIAVKTTGKYGLNSAAHHITARNCTLMTHKTACKIGTESRYDIHDVVFENIRIINSSRGCALWLRDGATYHDITFRTIQMNLFRIADEPWSGEAFRVAMQHRDGMGSMRDILFEDITALSPFRSILFSKLPQPVAGITFRNCRWQSRNDEPIPPITLQHAEAIQFIDCKLVHGHQHSPFARAMLQGPSADQAVIATDPDGD